MSLERIKIPVDVSAFDAHNLQEYLHILAMLQYLDLQFPSALCGILIKLTPTVIPVQYLRSVNMREMKSRLSYHDIVPMLLLYVSIKLWINIKYLVFNILVQSSLIDILL